MRLFISNSNNKFIIGIILLITVLIIFITEYFYKWNNVPLYWGRDHDLLIDQSKLSQKRILFIIGDSRAEAGVVPEIIDSRTSYNAYNIGIEGVYKGYYENLKFNNICPDKIIVGVSPYSIFNSFQLKKYNLFKRIYKEILILRKPNMFTEKYLSGLINRNTHLHYGFSGFFEVFLEGKVSGYYSSKGWHGYDRMGSDEFYTYMVNLEGYKYKIIEEYKDSIKINKGKSNFEKMLTDMHKNEMSILFVRIPTSNEIRKIENAKYPWFSSYINEIVNKYNYEYIEFNNFKYPTHGVDGSHLNRISANEFTKELVEYIK